MKRWLPLGLGLGLLLIVLLRTAWLCDDAFFTFRTVENWLGGYGPRWNVGDRAQAYTHPLWMLLLTAVSAMTDDVQASAIGLGVVCGLGTFVVLAWGRRPEVVALIAIALAGSKAWTDFATSGLENGLSGLLVAGFARLWLADRDPPTSVAMLIAGLLVLNRLDLAVVVLPALLAWAHQSPGRRRRLAIAALPIAGWFAFALFYYGTVLPTPALAKLAIGVPRWTLFEHGLWYLVQPLQLDWVSLPVLVLGLGLGLRSRPRALAAGGLLYLLYVVWIGGDFMAGRFHVVPFVMALALLAESVADSPATWLRAGVLAVTLLSLASPRSPLLSGAHYGSERDSWSRPYTVHRGVLDERAFYYPLSGLLSSAVPEPPAQRATSRRVEVGFFGRIPYEKGPLLHQVDPQALGDPFLARLPVNEEDLVAFRPGHAGRLVPSGYLMAWERCANMFTDPVLRPLYADVVLATQGPLLAPGRAGAIVRLLVHDLARLSRGEPLVPRDSIKQPWIAPGEAR